MFFESLSVSAYKAGAFPLSYGVLYGNPEEFSGICNRMGASPQMQEEIKEKLKEAGEKVEEPQNQELGKCLESFIKEYHRSTVF